jgi:hypothetical protein
LLSAAPDSIVTESDLNLAAPKARAARFQQVVFASFKQNCNDWGAWLSYWILAHIRQTTRTNAD